MPCGGSLLAPEGFRYILVIRSPMQDWPARYGPVTGIPPTAYLVRCMQSSCRALSTLWTLPSAYRRCTPQPACSCTAPTASACGMSFSAVQLQACLLSSHLLLPDIHSCSFSQTAHHHQDLLKLESHVSSACLACITTARAGISVGVGPAAFALCHTGMHYRISKCSPMLHSCKASWSQHRQLMQVWCSSATSLPGSCALWRYC